MIQFRPALSSKANDSDEYYGQIMAMMMTEMMVMIPIRTLLRSLALESRMKIIQTRAQAYMKANPTETRLGVTNGRYSFRKNITSQARFSTNKAMNIRCRSPEQHRRKGTTNSHTGNSTSTSLCTTSSPSLSSVCRRKGKGKGPCGSLCCGLSFPTPPLWFPVLWFHEA